MQIFGAAVLTLGVLLAVAAWFIPQRRRRRDERRAAERAALERAFAGQREQLEAKFFDLVAGSGKPRGLRWVECEFYTPPIFAREQGSEQLAAFVGVSIKFEAIEGEGMEEVAAVANRKLATAMFRTTDGRWTTDGRHLMNLEPAEAVAYFGDLLEATSPSQSSAD